MTLKLVAYTQITMEPPGFTSLERLRKARFVSGV